MCSIHRHTCNLLALLSTKLASGDPICDMYAIVSPRRGKPELPRSLDLLITTARCHLHHIPAATAMTGKVMPLIIIACCNSIWVSPNPPFRSPPLNTPASCCCNVPIIAMKLKTLLLLLLLQILLSNSPPNSPLLQFFFNFSFKTLLLLQFFFIKFSFKLSFLKKNSNSSSSSSSSSAKVL